MIIPQNRILAKQVAKELKDQAALTGTMTFAANFGSQLATVDAVAVPANKNEMEMQRIEPSKRAKDMEVDDIVEFEDKANLELVLKMLQFMCEGHNSKLQNYLRVQPDNILNIDLVSLSVELMHVMSESIDSHTIHLLVQVGSCFVGTRPHFDCRRSTR